jgi:FkbM family methyltransferase
MDAKLTWRAWKTRLRDQRCELSALRLALERGGVALDVGANKGSYLYWLAKWSRGAQVVGFEPQQKLAEYLTQALSRSGLGHTRVEHMALSDQVGEVTLYIPGQLDSPGASLERSVSEKTVCHEERVRMNTLDMYAAAHLNGPVRALKIDVEGHEWAVLKGAVKTLEQDHPVLVVECEERHMGGGATVRDVIGWVCERGYRASVCTPLGQEFDAAQYRPETHQKQIGERFWDAKDYCNNFIFRPI